MAPNEQPQHIGQGQISATIHYTFTVCVIAVVRNWVWVVATVLASSRGLEQKWIDREESLTTTQLHTIYTLVLHIRS